MKKLYTTLFVFALAVITTVTHYTVRRAWANTDWSAFTYVISNAITLRGDYVRWSDGGLNVKEYGAICDGSSHPLSTRYGSVGAAQVDYPFVDDLTQEIDWAAIQQTIDTIYNLGAKQRTVKLRDGAQCITSLPEYLDVPGNLRGGGVSWNAFFAYAAPYDTANVAGVTYISIQNGNLNHNPTTSPTWWRPLKWASGTTYASGDIVVWNGVPWVSQVGSNTNHTPTLANLTWWKSATNLLTPFRQYPYTLTSSDGLTGSAGATISANFNNAPGVVIGSGNGNTWRNTWVRAPDVSGPSGYRCGLPPEGIGILISGGSLGASRTLIENSGTYAWYRGIVTGGEQGSLGDSNTFRKDHIQFSCIGIDIAQTQNFINLIEDTNINYSGTAVRNVVGTPITIIGGNHSAVYSRAAAFTAAFSGVTMTGRNLTLSATITLRGDFLDAYFAAGILNAMTVQTAHFGVMPMTMSSYNSSTHVAQLAVRPNSVNYYYPGQDPVADTDLAAEIVAATKLYTAEYTTVWEGTGIYANGVHIESSGIACVRLLAAGSGFGAFQWNVLQNLNLDNTDAANTFLRPSNNPSDDNLAYYLTMTQFPFIEATTGGSSTYFYGNNFGLSGDPVMVELNNASMLSQLIFDKNTKQHINTRAVSGNGGFLNNHSYNTTNSDGFGAGEFDLFPFSYYVSDVNNGINWSQGWGRYPTWGVRPVPWTTPIVTPAQVATLNGTLPAITHTGTGANTVYTIGYPLLWGGQQYRAYDWYLPAQTHYGLILANHFYGYGQNLTTTNVPNLSLAYKGQSFAVYANVETFNIVFPGLHVILNDGSTDKLYIVTAIFPGMGYFTVMGVVDCCTSGLLSGAKTSVITPTTIKQEAYVITPLNFLLQRDLDPASNDNSPMWMSVAA